MGFETRKTNTSFWTIMMGSLVKKVTGDTPGSKERTNKNGDTIFEVFEEAFTGTLKNIKVEEKKFGEVFEMTFGDGGSDVQVSFNVYSQYGRDFMLKLPELDLNKEFTLRPYDFEPEGKRRVGISIIQDGDKVDKYWSKEKPGKKPDWVETEGKGKDKGKTIWNNDDEMEYLKEAAMKKFGKFTPEVTTEATNDAEEVAEEDDLPF